MRKQRLTATAARMKAIRDKKAAMTPKRRARKAQNQRIGQSSNKDIHHRSDGTTKKISISANRGFYGRGTKTE
jgi:hypothetical protein